MFDLTHRGKIESNLNKTRRGLPHAAYIGQAYLQDFYCP